MEYLPTIITIVQSLVIFYLLPIRNTLASLNSKIEKMDEKLTREHQEGKDQCSRDNEVVLKSMASFKEDVAEKIGKVMTDHGEHQQQNTRIETKIEELLSAKRGGK